MREMRKPLDFRTSRRNFLKSSSIFGVSALASSTAEADVFDSGYGIQTDRLSGKHRFSNWTQNINAQPNEVHRPKSLAELQDVVAKAQSARAVGSGHSFSPCAHTEATMIVMDDLSRILEVDYLNRRVKVEAGKKLFAFNNELETYGFALPSIGDIDVQSLAGVVSTGTHGTGMKWGSFSDQGTIHAMELVLADGSLKSLSADRPEDTQALSAARLSLGALGVIYSITFNVTEAHNLELKSWLMSLEEALDPRLYLENDHFEFFRFPFTDKVKAVTRNRTDKPRSAKSVWTFVDKILLENVTLGVLLNTASLKPDVMPSLSQMLTNLVPNESRVDRSDQVMASQRMVKAFELEYAIPITQVKQAHERFAEVARTFAEISGKRFYANFPSECRFIRGDQGNLLSPSQGTDVCYFSVMSHVAFAGYQEFFRAIEGEFLALGGRPHWGKQFFQNPTHLYPKWEEFCSYRRQWDPKDKFKNIYFERLLAGQNMVNDIA